MTTIILDDSREAPFLMKPLSYRLKDYMVELSKVRNRKDLVKLVKNGLRRHHLVEAAKKNIGKDLLEEISKHAGDVWIMNYLRGLKSEDFYSISKKYLPSLREEDLTETKYSPYRVPMLNSYSFYDIICKYGIACDVETVEDYLSSLDPVILIRSDIRRVCDLFVETFGIDDPISILLKEPKHRLIIEKGTLKEFHNIYGGIYSFIEQNGKIEVEYRSIFYKDDYRTPEGDIVDITPNGIYVNSYLLQCTNFIQFIIFNQKEMNVLDRGDSITIRRLNLNEVEIKNLPKRMKIGRGFPIQGIDLLHFYQDLKLEGMEKIIPKKIRNNLDMILSVELWDNYGTIKYTDGENYRLENIEQPTQISYYPVETFMKDNEIKLWILSDSQDYYANFMRISENHEIDLEGIKFVIDKLGTVTLL